MNNNVSFYRDVLDTEGKTISISTILNAIKNGKWKEQIATLRSIRDEKAQKSVKNSLPCFTPSGVFITRKVDGLKKHSSVIVVDIDTKENPGLLNECNEIR